jgi:hypothetical protein
MLQDSIFKSTQAILAKAAVFPVRFLAQVRATYAAMVSALMHPVAHTVAFALIVRFGIRAQGNVILIQLVLPQWPASAMRIEQE